MCGILCLASFTEHVFRVHPCITYVSILFPAMAKHYFIVWACQILSIHLLLDGQLGCFHLLIIRNNAAMNTYV